MPLNLLFKVGASLNSDEVVQGLVQSSSRSLQAWRSPSLSGYLFLCLANPTVKNVLLVSNWDFPYYSFCLLPLVAL